MNVAHGGGIRYFQPIMKTLTYLIVIVPLVLSGCGIPDLVATGVKAVEKSQDERDAKRAQQQQYTPPPAYSQQGPAGNADQPPPMAPAPARDSVTVEHLK